MIDVSYIYEITPYIMSGLKTTLIVFTLTMLFSIPIGLILGILSSYNKLFIKNIISVYTWVFRGTPLLLQLYFGMYGLPAFGITLDRMTVAVLIFALNYGAYFTEIFRGSIFSIDKGQEEVSETLGFTRVQTYFYIIIPQAVKRSIQTVGNETISLVKDTALIAAIALNDLLRNAKEIVSRDFRVEAFFVVAIIYIILSYLIVRFYKIFERKYAYFRWLMIKVKELYKKFDEKVILEGININFKPKSITSILGKSGEGKTTLLRIIANLETYSSGQIEMDDLDKIGMVFQDNQLYPHMTILNNLVLPQKVVLGLSKIDSKKIALATLKKLGVEDLSNNYPGSLSGGEQQRIAIARALVMEKNILMLDEPTSALDSSNTEKLIQLLLGLKNEGKTIIIITHDSNFAKSVSDDIYILKNKKINLKSDWFLIWVFFRTKV